MGERGGAVFLGLSSLSLFLGKRGKKEVPPKQAEKRGRPDLRIWGVVVLWQRGASQNGSYKKRATQVPHFPPVLPPSSPRPPCSEPRRTRGCARMEPWREWAPSGCLRCAFPTLRWPPQTLFGSLTRFLSRLALFLCPQNHNHKNC
jgi:hypothetical protein